MSLRFIDNFLEKFEKITPPDLFIRKSVQKEIKKITNMEISLKDIQYVSKTGEIKLKTNPYQKSEVFIKKDKILKSLKRKLGKKTPKNIF